MIVPRAPVCVAETKKQSPNDATTKRVGTEWTGASNDAAGTGKPAGVEAAVAVGADGGQQEEGEEEVPAVDAAIVVFDREEHEKQRGKKKTGQGIEKVSDGLIFFIIFFCLILLSLFLSFSVPLSEELCFIFSKKRKIPCSCGTSVA